MGTNEEAYALYNVPRSQRLNVCVIVLCGIRLKRRVSLGLNHRRLVTQVEISIQSGALAPKCDPSTRRIVWTVSVLPK